MPQTIKQVFGTEPRREGEYPDIFELGCPCRGIQVLSIQEVEDNLGTYGIKWFVAYDQDNNIIAKMNALHVSLVIYEEPAP